MSLNPLCYPFDLICRGSSHWQSKWVNAVNQSWSMLANAISKRIEGGGPENAIPKWPRITSTKDSKLLTDDFMNNWIQKPIVSSSFGQKFCYLKSGDLLKQHEPRRSRPAQSRGTQRNVSRRVRQHTVWSGAAISIFCLGVVDFIPNWQGIISWVPPNFEFLWNLSVKARFFTSRIMLTSWLLFL